MTNLLLPDSRVDFALVTALPEERDALLKKLPECQQLPPSESDIRTYYPGDLSFIFPDNSKGQYRIVVMCLLGMGRVQAAIATADLIRRWQPRYILLVGIAGGLAIRNIQIGDILVSDQVVDYELQKLTPQGPEVRWDVQRADPRLLDAYNNFRDENWLASIQIKRPKRGKPKRHLGPIASGDKVIAFSEVLTNYRAVWPRLMGVEMEAGGVATSAFQSPDKPGFFMIRGVSDLADENKGTENVEKWRDYACDIAASFAVAFLKRGPVPLVEFTSKIETQQLRKQEEEKEQEELLKVISETLETNPLKAIRVFLFLKSQISKEKHPLSLQTKIESLQTRIENHLGELLHNAGNAIYQGKIKYLTTILETIENFYAGEEAEQELYTQFRNFRLIFSELDIVSEQTERQEIEATFWLWKKYNEYAREIVVQSILNLAQKLNQPEMLQAAFRSGGNEMRRLLRDCRLRHIAPDLAHYDYEWAPISLEIAPVDETSVTKWLKEVVRLQNPVHPFSGRLEKDDFYYFDRWKVIHDLETTLIWTSSENDLRAARLMLTHEIQTAIRQTTFIVPLSLPVFAFKASPEPPAYMPLIARAVAEAWISCLPANPEALLDLPLPAQTRLTKLLVWAADSPTGLRLWLQQAGVKADAPGNSLLKQLDDLISPAPLSPPNQDELFFWLGLRPPNLHVTFILINCAPETSERLVKEQINFLLELSDELAKANVVLKVFVLSSQPWRSPPGIKNIHLKWTLESLLGIIRARLQKIFLSQAPSLGELFGPIPDTEADIKLAELARGSLHTLLEKGHALFFNHVNRASNDPYLDDADFPKP